MKYEKYKIVSTNHAKVRSWQRYHERTDRPPEETLWSDFRSIKLIEKGIYEVRKRDGKRYRVAKDGNTLIILTVL